MGRWLVVGGLTEVLVVWSVVGATRMPPRQAQDGAGLRFQTYVAPTEPVVLAVLLIGLGLLVVAGIALLARDLILGEDPAGEPLVRRHRPRDAVVHVVLAGVLGAAATYVASWAAVAGILAGDWPAGLAATLLVAWASMAAAVRLDGIFGPPGRAAGDSRRWGVVVAGAGWVAVVVVAIVAVEGDLYDVALELSRSPRNAAAGAAVAFAGVAAVGWLVAGRARRLVAPN